MLLLGACDQASGARVESGAAPGAPAAPTSTALTANTDPADKPALEQGASAPPSTPAPALAPEVVDWLRGASVREASFARGVLYSWTTPETAARLRKTAELFDDNQLPDGPTPYVRWLEHIASRGDPSGQLARALLGHPDLRTRRYAWPRPFAREDAR